MANRAYLVQLLETDRLYGGNNTVELCIKANDEINRLSARITDLIEEEMRTDITSPEVVDEMLTEMSHYERCVGGNVFDACGV